MLTADEAADIARKHGLTIADAVSLRALADDAEAAEDIAARFAASDEKAFAKQLFGGRSAKTRPPTTSDPAEHARRMFARKK